MFDLSFSEITVVLLVAFSVFNQKDLIKIMRQFRKIKNSILAQFHEYCKDAGIHEENSPEIKEIVDLDGEIRQAYSINHLEEVLNSKNVGEDGRKT